MRRLATTSASVDELGGSGIVKVPSGELTNLPYLRYLTRHRQHVLVSTGMANLGEIEAAISEIEKVGTKRDKMNILHRHIEFHATMEDVNLLAIG